MILLADSGSTKTEWLVLDATGDSIDSFYTKGFNPNHVSTMFMVDELKHSTQFMKAVQQTGKIFFYGSGCSTPELNGVVSEAIRFFNSSAIIEIKNDLYASVHATAGNQPAIVCILGTGSNSCFYDGNKVSSDDFSLGYILGDEGSGSFLGKQLIHDHFYHIMPENLHKAFHIKYNISRNEVIERIYRKPMPNEFLASFTPFLKEHIHEEYCLQLVKGTFQSFLQHFVLRFENAKNVPVHFTGSVAANFKDVLSDTANEYEIKIGKILTSPMEELSKYIQKSLTN
ncbi:MAG: hypothetical protein ACKVPJ_07015 [Chitinophagales bacterium]